MAFLRFVGILNAAIWVGSAVFLVVGLPAVFSPDLKRMLTDAGVGFVAERVVARYFILQYVCGGLACALLLTESMYSGKPVARLSLALAAGVLAIALAGGLGAQPRMIELHKQKYFARTLEERVRAGRSFGAWHGISESVNLLALGGLVVFLWRLTSPAEGPRAGYFPKIRS